ncbi:MAG: hypothetical protein ACOVP8_08945 [Phycisphaerales bacterium]
MMLTALGLPAGTAVKNGCPHTQARTTTMHFDAYGIPCKHTTLYRNKENNGQHHP